MSLWTELGASQKVFFWTKNTEGGKVGMEKLLARMERRGKKRGNECLNPRGSTISSKGRKVNSTRRKEGKNENEKIRANGKGRGEGG